MALLLLLLLIFTLVLFIASRTTNRELDVGFLAYRGQIRQVVVGAVESHCRQSSHSPLVGLGSRHTAQLFTSVTADAWRHGHPASRPTQPHHHHHHHRHRPRDVTGHVTTTRCHANPAMKNAFTVYTYHKRHAQRLTVRIKADAAGLTIRAALSLREVRKIVLTGNYFQVRVMRSVGLSVCLCVCAQPHANSYVHGFTWNFYQKQVLKVISSMV